MQLRFKHIRWAVACCGALLTATPMFSQDSTKVDLKDIEVNFLSSYYVQDGNNSPVTGGQGIEYLTNFAPSINLLIPMTDDRTLNIDGGVDFYSSASSDNINNPYVIPDMVSSASGKDERSYVTVNYKKKHSKQLEIGALLGTSMEWDVYSYSAGGSVGLTSKDQNKTVDFKLSYYFDDWKLIYPIEFRNGENQLLNTDKRHSVNSSVILSANLHKRVSASIVGDFVVQNGLLSTPFHRVYFSDKGPFDVDIPEHDIERLPSSRMKYPIGARINYHVTDFMILKTFYRYYQDTWGMTANTFEVTVPIKIGNAVRFYPFYRMHMQNQVEYFAPYREHLSTDMFYTSDFDLGTFDSQKVGAGLSITPLFGFGRFKYSKDKTALVKTIKMRYANYARSNGLSANVVTVGIQLNLKQ